VCRLRCRRHTLGGSVNVVQPAFGCAPVLDRAARQSDIERQAHRLSNTTRIRGEAVLEVS
jgi:hypothetical protein